MILSCFPLAMCWMVRNLKRNTIRKQLANGTEISLIALSFLSSSEMLKKETESVFSKHLACTRGSGGLSLLLQLLSCYSKWLCMCTITLLNKKWKWSVMNLIVTYSAQQAFRAIWESSTHSVMGSRIPKTCFSTRNKSRITICFLLLTKLISWVYTVHTSCVSSCN